MIDLFECFIGVFQYTLNYSIREYTVLQMKVSTQYSGLCHYQHADLTNPNPKQKISFQQWPY